MKQCRAADHCGACLGFSQSYEEQLVDKKNAVQELFPGIKVAPVLGMNDPYHYRHKIYATFGISRSGKVAAGMYEENSHDLVFEPQCLIQSTVGNKVISSLCRLANQYHLEPYDPETGKGVLRHAYLRVAHSSGDVLLTIVIGSRTLPASQDIVKALVKENPQIKTIVLNFNNRKTSMVLGTQERVLYGNGFITDTLCGLKFRISSKSFYQVNPEQAEVLYNKALEMAQLKPTDQIVDACCGIGTISLAAAKHVSQVIGVEVVETAIKDAIHNARRNRIENAEFYAMDINDFFQNLEGTPDAVIVDPPRAGLSQTTLDDLARTETPKIVYISCNPETQARDCKHLKRYGYRIRAIQPVDMFPYTKHVENIVVLTRNSGR